MSKKAAAVSLKFHWFHGVVIFLILLFVSTPMAYVHAQKAPVDLNTASEKELEALKGVGPATAKKIIAGRPYKSVDELSKAGLSNKQIEGLKPLVTVGAAEPAPVSKAPTPPKATAAKGEKGLVDLNTASEKELETLKGVGPATAKKIVAGRPYNSADELSKAGLSSKEIEALKPFVTVGSAAPTQPPAAPAVAPAKAASAKAPTAKLAPGQKVNINTASKAELEALPGIGPVKAQAIIDGRPYKKPDEMVKVKGIGDKTYNKIKDLITVD